MRNNSPLRESSCVEAYGTHPWHLPLQCSMTDSKFLRFLCVKNKASSKRLSIYGLHLAALACAGLPQAPPKERFQRGIIGKDREKVLFGRKNLTKKS